MPEAYLIDRMTDLHIQSRAFAMTSPPSPAVALTRIGRTWISRTWSPARVRALHLLMLGGDLHDDTITILTQASNVLGHRGLRSGNLTFEPGIGGVSSGSLPAEVFCGGSRRVTLVVGAQLQGLRQW